MKVLRISSCFHPPHTWLRDPTRSEYMRKYHAVGGMQLQVYLLTKALSEIDVEQEVITVKPPWTDTLEQWNKVTVRRYGVSFAIERQLYELPSLLAAIRRAPQGFDLIHVHHGEDIAAIPIALLAGRHAHIPTVITIHSSWNLTYRRTSSFPRSREILGKSVERVGFSQADALCTLTKRTAKLLQTKLNLDPNKVFVTPDGIDLTLFQSYESNDSVEFARKYHIPESSRYILFIGRLDPQKGVSFLLEAAAQLLKQGEEFVLILGGDGSERKALQRQVWKLSLESRVIFTGLIHHDDIPAALGLAHVFVVPSVYEELGGVILEAMAMKRAIVATSVGGVPDVIHPMENGLLVPPRDAESLAKAILMIFNNPSLATNLAAQASVDAHQYNLKNLAAQLKQIYLSVVG